MYFPRSTDSPIPSRFAESCSKNARSAWRPEWLLARAAKVRSVSAMPPAAKSWSPLWNAWATSYRAPADFLLNPKRSAPSYPSCSRNFNPQEGRMRINSFVAATAGLLMASGAFAASHRNGPLLLEDQTANLNDFYIFRSWEQGHTDSVVMSMSVQGFQNPDNGPSYYKFSNSVLYRFNVNNSRGLDGNPDMQVDFVFVDTIAPNAPFLSYFGQIKTIDDPGILLKETYVVVLRDLHAGTAQYFDQDVNGHVLSVAPPNTGPKGTPNYEQNLGQPSIFTLSNGMRVFAGPRDDAFYFDSGATFDTLHFRAPAPILTGAADTNTGGGTYPNAVDGFAGYNISLISVEVPIQMLTSDGTVPTNTANADAHIGVWASTHRQIVTVRPSPSDPISYGNYVQIDRVGNPLTVEALIPLPMKDYWNRSAPAQDAQFAQFIGDPFFASGVLHGVF